MTNILSTTPPALETHTAPLDSLDVIRLLCADGCTRDELSTRLNDKEKVNNLVTSFAEKGFHSRVGELLAELPFESTKMLDTKTLYKVIDFFREYPAQLAYMIVYGVTRAQAIKADDPTMPTALANFAYLSSVGYTKEWLGILEKYKMENPKGYAMYKGDYDSIGTTSPYLYLQ